MKRSFRILAVLIVSTCFTLCSTAYVQAEALSDEMVVERVGDLTPEFTFSRNFGDRVRYTGYNVPTDSVVKDGQMKVKLDDQYRFALELFFEQISLEDAPFQILIQAESIRYDQRTGLRLKPGNNEGGEEFAQRLEIDVARKLTHGTANARGGILKVPVEIQIPQYLLIEGQCGLSFRLIWPDKSVSESQFLNSFEFSNDVLATFADPPITEPASLNNNLLGNFSFETMPIVNTEKNWTLWNQRGVMQFLDSRTAVHGERSLRLDFLGGTNLHMYSKFQDVDVTPGEHYKLSWYARSQGLTSKSGVRLAVWKAEKAWDQFFVQSESLLGTNDWNNYELTFQVPQGVERIRVAILRTGDEDVLAPTPEDSLIAGSVWFDDMSLVKVSQ